MTHHLYLFDDHVNSFKYVSACLMEVLSHVPLQAEQCCQIAHNNGKCHIKSGDYMELLKLEEKLKNKELKVELRAEMYT